MSYEVLYRKWRPQAFDDVAGQEHVTATLRNAVKSGRIAHAYLFAGPRGTGKTSTGRILAKAINCESPEAGEPCNHCPSCENYLSGRALDLVEMDAASNRGIEDIRELRDRIGIAPGSSRYRVYLIDEVHQLTSAAFNALLKTLEEPPPHAVFILATTEAHEVPATIASRCQRFDFRRITLPAIVRRLREIAVAEEIEADDEALAQIGRQATGSLRDAVNLMDQIATQSGRRLTLDTVQDVLGLTGDARTREVARHLLTGDLGKTLEVLASVRDDGIEIRRFHKELLTMMRSLLIVKAGAGDTLGLTPEEQQQMAQTVDPIPAGEILKVTRALAAVDFRNDPQSSLPLELAIASSILADEKPARPAPASEARPAAAVVPPHAPPRRPDPAANLRDAQRRVAGAAPAAPREPAEPAVPPPTPPEAKPAADDRPAVAATVVGPPAGDTGLPADFVRQLYMTARKTNPKLAAFVNGSCDVAGWDPPRLTLGVFEHMKFVVDKLAAPEAKQLIEAAASELIGSPVQIVCVIMERKAREQAPPSGEAPRGGHLIEAARQMGAQPIGPSKP